MTSYAAEIRRSHALDQIARQASALVHQLDDPQTRINSAALAVKEHLRGLLADLDSSHVVRGYPVSPSGDGGPASLPAVTRADGHVNGAFMTAPEGPRPCDVSTDERGGEGADAPLIW